MRIHVIILSLLTLAIATTQTTFAQMAKVGCVDKSVRLQGEQMKHDFKAQGMTIYKDAMLSMISKEPYPVATQLLEKVLYQFVFVGSNNAGKLYFELFDGADVKLGDKTVDVKDGNNYIIYSFIPQKTDLYLLVVSQRVKGSKEVCGSFTIMQKANSGNAQ